jgi:hypothetical protein
LAPAVEVVVAGSAEQIVLAAAAVQVVVARAAPEVVASVAPEDGLAGLEGDGSLEGGQRVVIGQLADLAGRDGQHELVSCGPVDLAARALAVAFAHGCAVEHDLAARQRHVVQELGHLAVLRIGEVIGLREQERVARGSWETRQSGARIGRQVQQDGAIGVQALRKLDEAVAVVVLGQGRNLGVAPVLEAMDMLDVGLAGLDAAGGGDDREGLALQKQQGPALRLELLSSFRSAKNTRSALPKAWRAAVRLAPLRPVALCCPLIAPEARPWCPVWFCSVIDDSLGVPLSNFREVTRAELFQASSKNNRRPNGQAGIQP